jgi:ferritin-like metal-binding protein YciE
MSIDTTRDLFFYELGMIRDMEEAGKGLLEFLALRARDSDLVQVLRTQQQDSQQLLANVGSCLQALGRSPVETQAECVAGIRQRFQGFINLQPSPEMLDQFAIDTAIRFAYICIAGYKTLIDWAVLMEESQCVKGLHANLIRKQESAARLERFSHEIGVRLLTPA